MFRKSWSMDQQTRTEPIWYIHFIFPLVIFRRSVTSWYKMFLSLVCNRSLRFVKSLKYLPLVAATDRTERFDIETRYFCYDRCQLYIVLTWSYMALFTAIIIWKSGLNNIPNLTWATRYIYCDFLTWTKRNPYQYHEDSVENRRQLF